MHVAMLALPPLAHNWPGTALLRVHPIHKALARTLGRHPQSCTHHRPRTPSSACVGHRVHWVHHTRREPSNQQRPAGLKLGQQLPMRRRTIAGHKDVLHHPRGREVYAETLYEPSGNRQSRRFQASR